jgi:pheromone shutdown protein TraB
MLLMRLAFNCPSLMNPNKPITSAKAITVTYILSFSKDAIIIKVLIVRFFIAVDAYININRGWVFIFSIQASKTYSLYSKHVKAIYIALSALTFHLLRSYYKT